MEKAEIMFENYDRDMNNKLSRDEFKLMWDDVFKVIVTCTYYLTRGNIGVLVNPNQLKSYRDNLGKGKTVAFEEMQAKVFGEAEEVNKE